MHYRHIKRNNRVLLPVICLVILTGLFLAGLWPMNFHPENKVTWLTEENGVRFHGFGMAYSPGPLISRTRALGRDGPITIELYIHPHTEPGNRIARIVSLYDGRDREVFLIGQWRSHLIIQAQAPEIDRQRAFLEIGLDNILTKGRKRFLAIISGKEGTLVSLDGIRNQSFPRFSLLSGEKEDSGFLVLGNSPDGHNAWYGDILSLTVYDRLLPTEEVSGHFQNLLQFGNVLALRDMDPVIYYRFAERKGTFAQNQGDLRYNLLIPKIFHVLQKKFLVHPRQNFRFELSFFKDVVINVLGFVPFGYFFFVLLGDKKVPPGFTSYMVVLLMGCIISLSIELLQVYLPQRDSSITDLLCNITGTALGITISRKDVPTRWLDP